MKHINSLLPRAGRYAVSYLPRFVASSSFFWCIVALLVLQASWIALTSHYPMAFDEDFHLGIIKIYAHHLSPFLTSQPAGADMFGALARDPSYLYHYIFSFPYRLIRSFTDNETVIVIALRFLNITLFAADLVVFRKLLQRLKSPDGVINGCLLFFVLIPVVPQLAGQINYDNLFISAIAIDLLLTLKFTERLRTEKHIDVRLFLLMLSAWLLSSLVKYATLPVFAASMVYIFLQLFRVLGASIPVWRKAVRSSFDSSSSNAVSRLKLASLTFVTLISIGLFSQRYAVNVVRYHEPIPDCSKVLTIKQCRAYGPWIRDYDFSINKVDEAHNPLVFTGDWLYGMWLRLYFAVDGPATMYQSRGPLPVPALSAIAVGIAALLATIFGYRKLLKNYQASTVILFVGVSVVYISALWFDEYKAYVRTGQPVAINGRYLLPFLPLLLVLGALAGRELLRKHPRVFYATCGLILVSQLWGGGALTYILRSNDAWYRPSHVVQDANHAVQFVLGPVTPGYNQPAEFLK
jgi:hypothetical protein